MEEKVCTYVHMYICMYLGTYVSTYIVKYVWIDIMSSENVQSK